MQVVSIIISRYFYIIRHVFHRRVYIMCLNFVCTVFQCLVYFLWSVRTSFRLFCVPLNFIIQSVRFQTICNEMILQYTSEVRIWFPAVTFITLIIRLVWIVGWFLIDLFLSMFLKTFLSWVWNYTVTSPWLSKTCSLVISYWIVQIQTINLQVKYI